MTIKIRQRTSSSGKTHWQADIHVTLPNGKLLRERRMAQGRSKAAAMRWAKAREAHLLRYGKKTRERDEDKPPKLIDFVEQFRRDYLIANRLRPSTIQSWNSVLSQHLLPVLGDLRLNEIGPREVQLLKQRPLAASTTNFVLAKLGAMLRQANEWGIIAQVPKITSVKQVSSTPDYFSFADYERLIQVADDPLTRVIVLLGGDAGLRCGEIIALRWCNVFPDRNRIHVSENDVRGHVGPPKGGRDRWVPMTKQLRAELESLDRQSERVLWRGDGEPMSHSAVTFRLHKALKRAGIKKTGPHTLRHTFCSHLAMRGVSAVKIQRLAGHAKLATTQIYMHLAPSSLDDAIEALGR